MKTMIQGLGNLSAATMLLLLAQTALAATYEDNLEKSFPITPGGKLNIQGDVGTIRVSTDNTDQAQITVFRKVKGGTKAQADELFADQEVTFANDGNTVTVRARRKSQKSWSWRPGKPQFEVRYEARIPSKFDVDLRTAGGNIEVATLDGRATARTSSGMIKLEKVSGDVDANNSGGNISITEAGGKLVARTSSGSIQIAKIAGRAELSNSGGSIAVEAADQDVLASTSSGSIRLGSVGGNLKARNSGGDVSAKTVGGNAEVETSSGTIRLGAVKGKQLAAINSGGSVHVESSGGDANVRTSSGSIDMGSVGGLLIAKNSGGNISVAAAEQGVSAQTSSGAIKIKSLKGKAELSNSGGDVTVGESAGDLVARTSSGTIRIGAARGNSKLSNSGGSIRLGETQGAVTADTSSGEIAVGFTRPPAGDCQLQVSGGGINVALPGSSPISLDARTSGGRVVSEFPIIVQGSQNSGVLQGKINGGGPALVLRASSGDIRLKKSAVSETSPEAEASEK